MPRHSPCALINLATTDDARVHCAVLKIRAVPGPATRVATKGNRSWPRYGPWCLSAPRRPFPQDPTACSARSPSGPAFRAAHAAVLTGPAVTLGPNNQCSTNELATSDCVTRTRTPETWLWTRRIVRPVAPVLLRKEVIQPHLPVRLPCYDFVPIAGPTFDGSLPCGLGHRLRVLPTFVT